MQTPGIVWPECGTIGPIGEGELCTTNTSGSDCRAELTCLAFGSGNPNRCVRKCDLNAPCPKSGQTCSDTVIGTTITGLKFCNPPRDACNPNPCFVANQTQCVA